MSASDDGDPTSEPARIERQIEETRGQLTDTLTALERKLSARQITTDVIEAVRDTVMGTGDGQKTMLDLIRRNPLPAALIGVGLGWMVLGSTHRGPHRPAAIAPDPGAAATGTQALGPESALHLGGAARAHGTGGSPSRVERLQQRTGAMMQDNPLAVGALGLVIGALIGAILPMSRRESEWLAEAQQQVVDQAAAMGREAVERARDVAHEAGRAAVKVVERELGVDKPRTNGSRRDESIH